MVKDKLFSVYIDLLISFCDCAIPNNTGPHIYPNVFNNPGLEPAGPVIYIELVAPEAVFQAVIAPLN